MWNEFDPAQGLLKVPTIFKIARDHGLVTAIIAAKTKFKTLDLPHSLDAFVIPESPKADRIAAAFVAAVGKLKPNLCFIHFADPDTAGHNFGVNSPEKFQALAECDHALKTILDAIAAAGLTDSSVVIITADHGGHDRTPVENADRKAHGEPFQPGTHGSAESCDVVIPWIAWGQNVKTDYTITAPVVTYDTSATALWLLGIPVPEDFWGHPVTSAFQEK
jgi:bisphosphoglycerate-independent phosphoglycerate mutase (AlkP superfamily)